MSSISRLILSIAVIAAAQPVIAQQAKPPGQVQMQISIVTVTLLIKGTVMALHQANITGNYSVLRDLGTPLFREKLDQAALTAAFANLRARKVDLSPALLLSPALTKNPEINPNGELVLIGDFPTQPLQIHFELAFLQLDGAWRLAGIGVDAVPPRALATAATTGPTAPSLRSSRRPGSPKRRQRSQPAK